MKSTKIAVLVMVVVLVASSQVMALIEYDDGGTHNISTTINDDVSVDDKTPGVGTTVNVLTGTNIPDPYKLQSFNDSSLTMSGGYVRFLDTNDSSSLTVSGGELRSLRAFDHSTVTISGESVGNYWWANDDSRLTMSGGSVGGLRASGGSVVTISGGSVGNLYADLISTITIIGGSIGDLRTEYESTVTISGGSMGDLEVEDDSTVTISDGSMGNLKTFQRSTVTISDGSMGNLYAEDRSVVTISGGSMGNLEAEDGSAVTMSGGSVGGYLHATWGGKVTMSGGYVDGDLLLEDISTLLLYGSDFAIDGISVDYGDITSLLGGYYYDDPFRTLTGILQNGDILNNQFRIGDDAYITLAVPEPCSLVLLSLGGLMLRRRKA